MSDGIKMNIEGQGVVENKLYDNKTDAQLTVQDAKDMNLTAKN